VNQKNGPHRGHKVQHPPPRSEEGQLARSIKAFADSHNPPIKCEGMRNAIDVLTECKSPGGGYYDFHYEIDKYWPDGVHIQRKLGLPQPRLFLKYYIPLLTYTTCSFPIPRLRVRCHTHFRPGALLKSRLPSIRGLLPLTWWALMTGGPQKLAGVDRRRLIHL